MTVPQSKLKSICSTIAALKWTVSELGRSISKLEREIMSLDPVTITLAEVLAVVTDVRAKKTMLRVAFELGCKPETRDTWTVGPLLNMDENDWLVVKNCGVHTANAIKQALKPFRVQAAASADGDAQRDAHAKHAAGDR